MSAPAQMCTHINIPTLSAQKGQVSDCRLTARQDNCICIPWQGMPGPYHANLHPRFGFQRVKIVKIGNA